MLVYLAGPITGVSYDGTTQWRQQAIDYLNDFGIQGLSPMRGLEHLVGQQSIEDSYEENPLFTQRGVYTRDKFDCHRADLVIVNLLGTTRVSIGTMMEIAWAAQNNTPIVLVMEKQGNLHDHSMVREACPIRVDSIEEALLTTIAILAPSKKA